MNKKIIVDFLVIVFFLIGTVSSGIAPTRSYAVGDSFTFTVLDATDSLFINGTDYSKLDNSTTDNEFTYTITGLNSTTVNVTYYNNGVNKTAYTRIDYPLTYLNMYLFLARLSIGFMIPQYAEFTPPDYSSTSSSDSNSSILTTGFFASGNITYYKTLLNTTAFSLDITNFPTSGGYLYKTNSAGAINEQVGNNYIIGYNLSVTKYNNLQNFSYTVDSAYKAIIDLSRNIITEYYVKFNSDLIYNNATVVKNLSFRVVEETGISQTTSINTSSNTISKSDSTIPSSNSSLNATTNGLPGFDLLAILTLASIFAIVFLFKRRKKRV